jgi:SanA protein
MAKKPRKKKRFLLWAFLCFVVLPSAVVWGTNAAVLSSSEGRIFVDVEKVPPTPVAVVLGTAPYFNGHKNPFFERRMDAAAELYKAHKVDKVLVSGDNHSTTYDEPTAMRDGLVARGVPAGKVVLDYAGFRTLDTIVRAHRVFGVQKCVLVTDDFHLARALYIASNEGLDAMGFQTKALPTSVSPWTHVREVGSRTLVWLDLHILNRQPRFLGHKETL